MSGQKMGPLSRALTLGRRRADGYKVNLPRGAREQFRFALHAIGWGIGFVDRQHAHHFAGSLGFQNRGDAPAKLDDLPTSEFVEGHVWRLSGVEVSGKKNPLPGCSAELRGCGERKSAVEAASLAELPSNGFQIVGRRLPGPSVSNDLIDDLLALVETVHPGTLYGADMDEHILAAVIRLDEAKAFLAVEPLHGSLRHETFPSGAS